MKRNNGNLYRLETNILLRSLITNDNKNNNEKISLVHSFKQKIQKYCCPFLKIYVCKNKRFLYMQLGKCKTEWDVFATSPRCEYTVEFHVRNVKRNVRDDGVIGSHPWLIGSLGGTTLPNAELPGPPCKSEGKTRPSSAWRHSRWMLPSHPFSLSALLYEHDISQWERMAMYSCCSISMASTISSEAKLSPMASRTRRGSSHAGQNSSVCCAVSSSSSQWWHVLVTSRRILSRNSSNAPCPVSTCVILYVSGSPPRSL